MMQVRFGAVPAAGWLRRPRPQAECQALRGAGHPEGLTTRELSGVATRETSGRPVRRRGGSSAMAARYPEIEPYEHGMLDVGDGNQVYWETCGNPDGKPVVVLHGGPGSGCRPSARGAYLDPAAYRIVLLDQRNCGRSRPHASDPATDLSANTTDHLIADLEAAARAPRHRAPGRSVRRLVGLPPSASSTPSATRERVTELVLMGLATGRRAETDLLTRGLGGLFPADVGAIPCIWLPENERDGDLPDAYARLLADPDPRCARARPGPGATGRRRSSRPRRGRTAATRTRTSGWRSRGS